MVNNLFWGLLILVFGLSIIIKSIFGFSFPIIKPLIGVFLIYLGIVIILNLSHEKNIVRFGTSHFQDTYPARKYSIVFGQGKIDLSHMEPPTKPTHIKISTIFGQSDITLNKNIPTTLKLNSVFAETELPYAHLEQTGNNYYQMGSETPLLSIEIEVIFGKTTVQAV